MLQLIARLMNYGALALAFLFYAVAAYVAGSGAGGLIGAALSIAPLVLVSGLGHDGNSTTAVFSGAGALIGAGYGLILMWRFWIAYLQRNNDEALRNLGNFFDELRHAVRYKP